MIKEILEKLLSILLKRPKTELSDKETQTETVPGSEEIKHDYSEEQLKLFESTMPGDLVFAEMPLNKTELEKVKEGHRSRPYLIVSKEEDHLLGYYCTSSEKEAGPILNEYRLLHNKYGLTKYGKNNEAVPVDTIVSLNRTYRLEPRHLKYCMLSIDNYDRIQINKRIRLLNNSRLVYFDIEDQAYPGEIYSDSGKMYYVYETDKMNLGCFRLVPTEKLKNTICIRGRRYRVDIDVLTGKRLEDCTLEVLMDRSLKNRVEQMVKDAKRDRKVRNRQQIENTGSKICRYPIGTIFSNYNNDRAMIYLYSTDKCDYGVDYLNAKDGYSQIKQFRIDRNIGALFRADDSLVADIVEGVIELSPKMAVFFDKYYNLADRI